MKSHFIKVLLSNHGDGNGIEHTFPNYTAMLDAAHLSFKMRTVFKGENYVIRAGVQCGNMQISGFNITGWIGGGVAVALFGQTQTQQVAFNAGDDCYIVPAISTGCYSYTIDAMVKRIEEALTVKIPRTCRCGRLAYVNYKEPMCLDCFRREAARLFEDHLIF